MYVFDADLSANGGSTCTGACTATWPPVTPPSGTLVSPWSSFMRSDGTMQLSYNGRPLYTYVADTSGTTNGDGIDAFGGLWHVARPQGSVAAASPSPGATVAANPTPTATACNNPYGC